MPSSKATIPTIGLRPDSRRWWMIFQLSFVLVAGATLALLSRPEPHSDWLYYWNAAGQPGEYQRGGLGLWLLALPKMLGASPVVAALALNLPTAAALGWLAYRCDRTRLRVFAQLGMFYLLLLVPFFGLVQLDMVATLQLGLAFWLLFDPDAAAFGRWGKAGAVGAVSFAVSTKPQYALILWTLVGTACIVAVWLRHRLHGRFMPAMLVLLAGSLLGFAVDLGLRQMSGQTESIRTSSAVTLYAGLLASGDTRESGCGSWSLAATSAAKQDIHKPLPVAVMDRLSSEPLPHWWAIVRCKIPDIVNPPPFAINWLSQAPNVRSWMDSHRDRTAFEARYFPLLRIEKLVYSILVLSILSASFWTCLRSSRRQDGLSILPVLWVFSFWLVHAIFEIQGRYFLGMLMLAPMLCALAYRYAPVKALGRGEDPANEQAGKQR